jgi:hypothetical protein
VGSVIVRQTARQQAAFDREAAADADPSRFDSLKEPLTPSVAKAIHARWPGTIRYIGRQVVNPASPDGHVMTDLDIQTDHVVIQVKSGGSDGLSKQIDKSRMVTQAPVVAFVPKMSEARLTWYREHGYVVFRRLPELLDFLDSKR